MSSPAALESKDADMEVLKGRIKDHYDQCSPHYQDLWGKHIHHGLWRPGFDHLTKEEAQERLVDEMLSHANLPDPSTNTVKILDVGCGVGGTSIKLSLLGYQMTGVSLSPKQIEMAKENMAKENANVRFICMDGEQLDFPGEDGTFDAVWISEALSHFPHKEKFFQHTMRLLKPGGKWVCVDWFKADNISQRLTDGVVADIEKGMLLPKLEPVSRYFTLFTEAGGRIIYVDDVSKYCARTWDICLDLIAKPALWKMAWTMGSDFVAFLNAFKAMRDGFAVGAFRFTIVIGEKPTVEESN